MSENVTSGPRQRAVGPGDRYVLGELLGRGGMADVYRAQDQVLGRAVAVKLLRERATDPLGRSRFVAEAKTLARLNHPNLVTILDAGISDEHPYLVLELVIGSSLSSELKEGDAILLPARVAGIGAQVAAALAHCHAAGVVHRDVKPGNILVGSGGRVLLTDFGISRLLDGSTHHTQTGTTIGTASYLAPEQVHGDELTPAVDLYALGLVLLEMCTGRREYQGSPVEAAVARLHRSPRIPAHLPPALASLLRSLTRTDPAARPTASETARALGEADPAAWDVSASLPQDTGPLDARDVVPGEQDAASAATTVSRTRRHGRLPLLALSGGAAVAAAVVGLALALHGPSTSPPAPSTPTTSRQGSTATSAPASPKISAAADVAVSPSASRKGVAVRHRPARKKKVTSKPEAHAPARTKAAKPAKASKRPVKSHGHHGGKNK